MEIDLIFNSFDKRIVKPTTTMNSGTGVQSFAFHFKQEINHLLKQGPVGDLIVKSLPIEIWCTELARFGWRWVFMDFFQQHFGNYENLT